MKQARQEAMCGAIIGRQKKLAARSIRPSSYGIAGEPRVGASRQIILPAERLRYFGAAQLAQELV